MTGTKTQFRIVQYDGCGWANQVLVADIVTSTVLLSS